jgi:hypothetical protein
MGIQPQDLLTDITNALGSGSSGEKSKGQGGKGERIE